MGHGLLCVCPQLECEEHGIHCQQYETQPSGHLEEIIELFADRCFRIRVPSLIDNGLRARIGVVVRRGEDDRGEGDTEQRDVHLRSDNTVELFVETKTTGKVRHSEDEQDIGEDRPDHTGLHNVDVTLDESKDGDQKLNSVTAVSTNFDQSWRNTHPNVALSSPPQASPTRWASSSVANDRPPARGIIARRDVTKMTVGD